MSIKTIYIDDDDTELRKYRAKFQSGEKTATQFTIISLLSPKSVEDYRTIDDERPELFLVDFNLEKPDGEGNVSSINGVTLSTELKHRFPEVPIVLFTRKSVFKVGNYEPNKLLSSVDQILYKQDAFGSDPVNLEETYRLALDFKKLREHKTRGWNDMLRLVGASRTDSDLLAQTAQFIASGRAWKVALLATWVRNVLLKYPGIVYNPVYAATYLGVSKEAFLSESIQDFFRRAQYTGVFAPAEGRWWKNRLHRVANSIMNKQEKNLPLRYGFSKAWERLRGNRVEMARCVFSGETPAEWVCHILEQPVMLQYSLSYAADQRPTVMDEARVSYEAVRTSNEFNERFVDDIGRELIPEIRKLQKPDKLPNAD